MDQRYVPGGHYNKLRARVSVKSLCFMNGTAKDASVKSSCNEVFRHCNLAIPGELFCAD